MLQDEVVTRPITAGSWMCEPVANLLVQVLVLGLVLGMRRGRGEGGRNSL